MTRRLSLLLGVALLAPAAAAGQAMPQHAPTPAHPHSMEDALFPPERVMQHQRELGLSAQQRATITEAIKALQSGVVDHQWQIQDEQQKLHELLGRATVDESAVLAQLDRVLELERNVKRLHLTMLIRIRNALTPEQQEKLKNLKSEHEGDHPPAHQPGQV